MCLHKECEGCFGTRAETTFPGADKILEGAVPVEVRGPQHTAPTCIRGPQEDIDVSTVIAAPSHLHYLTENLMHKKTLRALARQKRQLCFEHQGDEACKAAAYFLEWLEGRTVHTITLYREMNTELSTEPLLRALYELAIPTALPRITDGALTFHGWSWGDPLEKDSFGFSCPLQDTPTVTPDIFVIPLLAYDDAGHRLGYGQGHYDKALVNYPDATKVGFAFSAQRIPSIPAGEYDIPLDFIITEKGIETFA